jgi:DNA-binding NarL/FixJ family response regulator
MSLPGEPAESPVIRVLIVASAVLEADLRDALSTAPGVEVAGATADGDEGLRLAVDLEPDVALIELEAPGVDGLALTERIAGRLVATCVVIVSELRDDDVRRAMMAGAGDVFARPVSGGELTAAIQRLVRSGSTGRLVSILRATHRQETPGQGSQESLRARLRRRVLRDRSTGAKIVDLVRIACEQALNAEDVALGPGERERLVQMVLRDVLLEILAGL